MSAADQARWTVVLAMSRRSRRELLPPYLTDRLAAVAEVDTDRLVQDFRDPEHAACLADADVLLTGWGVPAIDDAALAAMPRLRAVVHGAGSVKGFLDRRVFDRGIAVSSAAAANAVPVAEFTFGAIIFAAKRVGRFAQLYREHRTAGALDLPVPGVGAFGVTVGVVGASRIGRRVLALLQHLDVDILVSDPYIDEATADDLGATLVQPDELVARSDIVTLHAPDVPATQHLIDARRLGMMRDGATLINTARGRLVDTDALVPELVGGRLDAVLDVTDPEPLPADSPLFELPNVLLTPHVAGALGNEVARLGELAVSEIERLAAGLPLAHPVLAQDLDRIA
jgi:phosphoglycerate dehydrogenase-like enzyme